MRGVLLDAGGTLIGPRGGRWNPRVDFEEVLLRHWPDAPRSRFLEAFAEGERFLRSYGRTPPRDLYHRAILQQLGMLHPTDALLAELDAPLAPDAVFEVFPDVHPALERLRERRLKMAVVSDNWAGLEDAFETLGLRCFFDVFVVSELLGCRKPDPRMYHTASDRLGLAPGECLFVDDDPDLVSAAIDLGYRGVVIDRKRETTAARAHRISTLAELPDLVGA